MQRVRVQGVSGIWGIYRHVEFRVSCGLQGLEHTVFAFLRLTVIGLRGIYMSMGGWFHALGHL